MFLDEEDLKNMVVLNIKDVCHECIHFAPDIAQYPGIKVTDDVLPDGDMIIECAHRHTCQHWQDDSDTVIEWREDKNESE